MVPVVFFLILSIRKLRHSRRFRRKQPLDQQMRLIGCLQFLRVRFNSAHESREIECEWIGRQSDSSWVVNWYWLEAREQFRDCQLCKLGIWRCDMCLNVREQEVTNVRAEFWVVRRVFGCWCPRDIPTSFKVNSANPSRLQQQKTHHSNVLLRESVCVKITDDERQTSYECL